MLPDSHTCTLGDFKKLTLCFIFLCPNRFVYETATLSLETRPQVQKLELETTRRP